MNKEEKLWLFWACAIAGIFCITVGVCQFSTGLGWIVGGILSFLVIPVGLEFSKKFMK